MIIINIYIKYNNNKFIKFSRDQISPEDSNMSKLFHWYTGVNAALLDHLTNQIKETDNSGVWRYEIL